MAIFPIRIIKGEQQLNIALDLDGKYPNENLEINRLTHGNIYEPDVSNFLVRVLREGDTVIDVGANIGFFSVLSSTLVGDSGKVVSFDPYQSNCDLLKYVSCFSSVFEAVSTQSLTSFRFDLAISQIKSFPFAA